MIFSLLVGFNTCSYCLFMIFHGLHLDLQMASGPQVARDEKIAMLTEKINDLVQKAEELGCEGKVDDAQGMMKLCEQLTEERTQLENVRT